MKRFFSMAALVALTTGGAAAQATAATATAALDVNSAYVWRGMTFNNGLVMQPSMDVSANGFAFNVWGNYDVDDYDGKLEDNQFSEIDLTASYAFKMGAVDASVGVIEYTFPNGGEATGEIFAGLGYDLGAGFVVSSKVYYDFDQAGGLYVTAGLGYTYSINEKTTLGLNGMISYATEDWATFYNKTDEYPTDSDSGFYNYMLTASVKYMVTDAFAVGANINYTDSMDDEVLQDHKVDTTFFGGVNLTYTF